MWKDPGVGTSKLGCYRNLNADIESAVRVQNRDVTIVTAGRLPLCWNLGRSLGRYTAVAVRPHELINGIKQPISALVVRYTLITRELYMLQFGLMFGLLRNNTNQMTKKLVVFLNTWNSSYTHRRWNCLTQSDNHRIGNQGCLMSLNRLLDVTKYMNSTSSITSKI